MTRFVLDASVALAWVVDRGAEPYAIAVQNKILKGDRPIVPEFWQLEIANVLALVLRKGTLTADEIESIKKWIDGGAIWPTGVVMTPSTQPAALSP